MTTRNANYSAKGHMTSTFQMTSVIRLQISRVIRDKASVTLTVINKICSNIGTCIIALSTQYKILQNILEHSRSLFDTYPHHRARSTTTNLSPVRP